MAPKTNRTMTGVAEDVVFTPPHIAKDIVEFFKPAGYCIDPCKGDGVFFNLLPEGSDWFEITEGRDFFTFEGTVDWLVSNPPYSIFESFMDHSYTVANDIVYLIPVGKLMTSMVKLRKLYAWGGIKHIRYYGSGRSIGFPFGFPTAAIHVSKGYVGEMGISFYERSE